MGGFDRRELLKRSAFAALAASLPGPALAHLERLADEYESEAPLAEMAAVLVCRGHGYGKAYLLRRVSPELLDEPFGLDFLQAISVEEFVSLQNAEPGRASDPVALDGRYRLVDAGSRGTIEHWREHATVEIDSAGLLSLELVDV